MNAFLQNFKKSIINPSSEKILKKPNSSKKDLIPIEYKKKIIDCSGLSKMLTNDFEKKIPLIMENFQIKNKPKLKMISVGDKIDNKIYIDNKIKACEKIGIDYEHKMFSGETKIEKIYSEILQSNNDNSVSGIILQLPLTDELNPYSDDLLNQISLEKDVDGLNENTLKNFINYKQGELDKIIFSPTALGVMEMVRMCLSHENDVISFRQNHWRYYSFNEKPFDLTGKNVCLLGIGKTAGLPISLLMKKCEGNLKVCDVNTPKEIFEENLRNSDIVISAVGKINLVKKELLKEGCIVIDVGINLIPHQEKRRICGDVDFFECIEKVKYISTVPGGVGKMTVIMLLRNVIKAWLYQNEINGEHIDLIFSKDSNVHFTF